MEPRYVPKPCIRNFESDFRTLVPDSWRFRRFVNRALKAHFWNVSFGLWCPCQPPIDSPYFDQENSLPLIPQSSTDSVLSFVRDMAISQRVPLRRLAETNNSTAQILSFRRYTVDFKISESVYNEIVQSKCSGVKQLVDKVVQPLSNSDCSIMKACETMARTADQEDDCHLLKSIEHCQNEQSICLLNPEPAIEDITKDVTVSAHDEIIGSDDRALTSAPLVNASNEVFLAKPVSFVVPKAWETLPCSAKETYAKPNKPDSTMISVEPSDLSTFNGTREICLDDALEVGQVSLHITGTSNRGFSSDDTDIAPAEQLQDLVATATVDDFRSLGVKRKARRDKAFVDNSKRKKKANQESISKDKSLNLNLFKDIRLADPKCLRMKFLSRHGNLPSKAELLKRFSVFGKIDPSRTDVNPEERSAKVVFLQSIDAVTAYQFARTKKFTLGRYKIIFRLDPFEDTREVNKIPSPPMIQKPQKFVPNPKSCLKDHGSVDKEKRSNLKVKFQMET